MPGQEHIKQAEQHDGDDDHEPEKAVAGDAFLIAQRTQAVHATGSEVIHEARIAGGRAAKMVPQAIPQRGQIIFANAEFVEQFRHFRRRIAAKFGGVDGFENRFSGLIRRWRIFLGVARNGLAGGGGSGTKFWFRVPLQLRVELLDLGFERGNFISEGARLVRDRVGLFFGERHTSMPREDGDEHTERQQGHD